MAINKSALIRYRILDKCFSNPVKKYFIEDLLEACNSSLFEINPNSNGIKKRQLYTDINFMQSAEGWNAPIITNKKGRMVYYRYEDSSFSIDNQPLNQAELEQLRSAMLVLSRLQGMPQFGWVNELIPKLEQSFLLENNDQQILGFDHNQYLIGIEHLDRLFHDILYKRVLSIQYQSFKSDKPNELVFHPYFLKQYNNRWFLFGRTNGIAKTTTLALDRIKLISEKEGLSYIPNTILDFNEYFEDIIGVTLQDDSELKLIKLAFSPSLAPYILSKPLHGSQTTISNSDDKLVISIEVYPNYELESLILSHGEGVEVLEPIEFREKMMERLKKALDGYED